MNLSQAISNLQSIMKREAIDTTKGLPQDLFLLATTLMPNVNIDLFITKKNKLLLTWRDDQYYGRGWHIPGGCLRLMETLDTRIQETAKIEIGTEVIYDRKKYIIKELMLRENRPLLDNQLERCHSISLLFFSTLPESFTIKNNTNTEHSSGYKKWFDYLPEDLLEVHRDLYGDIINSFFAGGRI